MDLKPKHGSSVVADPRVGIHSGLLGASFPSSKYITIPRKKPGKLDDVLSNGWLDAMKSSSPPRKKFIVFDRATDDAEIAYCSWMLKHPSALNCFEQIMKNASKKKIAIFLDYDGTLSPIVDHPERALLSKAMRCAVENVAFYFPTAVISGRSRDKVYELVGLTELYYAGSHGMDIMCPVHGSAADSDNEPHSEKSFDNKGKELTLFQPAREFLPMIDEVYRTLGENTKGIDGAKVENHKFCTSVHYRNVEEKNWPVIAQIVHDVLKDYPRLRLTHGRKVLEVRPMIDWDKGKAVEFLLESLGLGNRDDVLPIYIGDDTTDEDAFKVLREGKKGYGIRVTSIPRETKAFYSLRDTSEVMEFLQTLVRWKELEEEAE